MYRTYNLTGDEEYVTSFWDGDTFSYTVYDNKAEMEEDKKRLKKIDDEWKKKKHI